MVKEGEGMFSGQSGYEHIQKDQRKYFKGKGKTMGCGKGKETKKNIPGMSIHPVVNCNEAMRKQSKNMGEMRGGEKKNIKGAF